MTAAEEIFDNALAAQSGNKYACDQIELARIWFYQQLYNGYHEQIVAAGMELVLRTWNMDRGFFIMK